MPGLRLSLRSKSRRRVAVPFHPSNTGKCTGLLDLSASSPDGGTWATVVDVLNAGSPMVQPVPGRRSSVGASANGVPTMVFSGANVHLLPASPSAVSTTKIGLWFWVRFSAAAITAGGTLISHLNGAGGSTLSRLDLSLQNSGGASTNLAIQTYITNTAGRRLYTPFSGVTHSVWYAMYLQYDSSRGGDPNVVFFQNGVAQSFSVLQNIGAGGTLTTLQAANGSLVIGAGNDSDTPTSPLGNGTEFVPPVVFNDNLTPAEIASMLLWRAP
jgi:hypothetical protein